MRSLQKTCLFLLTISLLVFSFESQLNTGSDIQLQQSEPNLTVEEVLEIALSDPDIAFFAEQYEAEVKINLDGEVWVVHFVGGNGDERTEIIVYIEDATGEIIDIDWILSLQCCYYEEPEIIKKAVEFVKNLDILQSLQDNHEIEWWGYSRSGYDDVPIAYDSVGTNQEGVEYDNLINVWGNWDNGYVTVNVRAEELDLQVFGYDILDVVATDYFGDPVNNFQAIEALALEDPLVIEYIKNHTDYGMDIILGLIVEALDYPFYDNNLSFATGYYYQVMFNSNHYDYPVTTVTDSSQDKGGLGLAQTEQGDYIVDDYYYYNDWLTVLIDDKT
ncbi:MAG: hypothetical protein IH840_12445, partial [Candidatus Heimdallarchaeota archaeon]|nr:hypothetical protein [Candidatus Heimdallarchaeota archaeon]